MRWILAAVTVLIFIGTMVAIWTFPQPAQGMRAAAGGLAGNIELLASEAASPVLTRLGLASTPQARTDVELPAPPKPAPRPAPPAPRATPEAPAVVEPALLTPADPLPDVEYPTGLTIDDRVYSAADADVTPARALNATFPSQPAVGADPDRLGLVEYVVSEFGQVESVKILRGPSNVIDAIVLPAVKAWRFAPATKDGRPVKYRHEILLTY
jgi:protein TonB